VGPSHGVVPRVLVGVLVILAVGAIALSLSTAPPVAVSQLRAAAGATSAASGFVLDDTGKVTSVLPGVPASAQQRLASTDVVHIVYQAPDRVQDQTTTSGGTGTAIVIGSRRYQLRGGRWVELAPVAGLGRSAAGVVLYPLEAARSATVVTRRGGVYTFLPDDLDRFTTTLLRTHVAQLTSVSVTAVVDGDHVRRETVSALLGGSRLSLDLLFSSIGTAPAVLPPPPSLVVPYRPVAPAG